MASGIGSSNYMGAGMKEFKVVKVCALTETITVEADTIEEAMDKAENIQIPLEHDISWSFAVDREETLSQHKERADVEALRGERLSKGSSRP